MTTLRTHGALGAAVLLALCGCSDGPRVAQAAAVETTTSRAQDPSLVVPLPPVGQEDLRARHAALTARARPARSAPQPAPARPRGPIAGPPHFVQVAPRPAAPVPPAPYPVPSAELHAHLEAFAAEKGLELGGPVELHEPAIERLRVSPEAELSEGVRAKLDGILQRSFGGRSHDEHDRQLELRWIDELLRIVIPREGRGPLHAYVGNVPEWSSWPYDDVRFLFVHDPDTDAVTPEPLHLNARWLGEEGLRPSWADLEGDGRPELVYRDFAHNGTVENRDERVYLAIGDDLSLREVFRHTRHDQETLLDHEWVEVFSRPLRARDGDGLCLLLERWSKELYTTEIERSRPAHLYRWSESGSTWATTDADKQ